MCLALWLCVAVCVATSTPPTTILRPPKSKGSSATPSTDEIAPSDYVIPPAPLVQGDWWKSFEGWQPSFTLTSFRSYSTGGAPIGFAYHDGFLSFANSQALDSGDGGSMTLLWTQSGELLTIGLLADHDGWLGVGVSPNGQMLYGGSNDATIGWTDGSDLGAGGNTFIGDYRLTSRSPAGVTVAGNQALISADVVRVGNQTAIVMQRFLRATKALSINATGVSTLIYAKGPRPASPGLLSKHSFASSVRVCFSGPRCADLNAPQLLKPIPNQTVVEGKPFQLNLGPYFRAVSNESFPLTYAISGLLWGTGIRVDPKSGIFTGTPTATDIAASPMNITVKVTDKFGNVANTSFLVLSLSARCSPFTNCSSCAQNACYFVEGGVCADRCQSGLVCVYGGAQCPNPPILLFPIPYQSAKLATPFFLNAFPNFQGDSLSFSLKGLPVQSGLTIAADTGAVSGKPTDADLVASSLTPLALAVVARDKFGMTVSAPFSMQVFGQNHCNQDFDCGTSGYCASSVCVDYALGGQVCTPNGVRCNPKFQCMPSNTGGFTCAILDCQSANTCSDCVMYGCSWLTGFGCSTRCAQQVGCTNPGGVCPAMGRPLQLSPIPVQRAVAGRSFVTSFRDYFVDQDRQPLVFSLSPLSTSWTFDASRGVLSGVPNAQDVARSPSNLTLTVATLQGLASTATVTLFVDGQCGLINYCDTCLSAGCVFVGSTCRQDCPYGAVCATDSKLCPGRKVGQECSLSNVCSPELVCLLSPSGAQTCQLPVSCDAFYACDDCLARSCYWSGGMCSSNCTAGTSCYSNSSSACPVHTIAVAAFNGPVVNGYVIFDQESSVAPVTVTASLTYTSIGQQDANHSWRVHNNRVQTSYDCAAASTVFNPNNVDGTSLDYASKCKQNNANCQLGDLSGKFGNLDIPSGVRTFRDPMLSLFGKSTIVARSLVVYTSNGVAPDRLACANIALVDPGPPRVFTAIPDYHILPSRPISLSLGTYFFNPAPNAVLQFAISDLSFTRLRFNTNTGLLEGLPPTGGPPIVVTITANNQLGSVAQTFTLYLDGVCILDADCMQGYCQLGLCLPFRDAHQTCGAQQPCASPYECTLNQNLRRQSTCELVDCDPSACRSKGYCADGACMPFRWLGDSCSRVQICAVGLSCDIRFSGQGICIQTGALVPPITSVEGLVVSFNFGSYMSGSSFTVFGLPSQTGLTMDTATGHLYGRLAYGDANARQPLLLTAYVQNPTSNNSQATLALTVKPAGTCGVLSSCRQCIANSCSWCPKAGLCGTECSQEDPTHTCPLEACQFDQDCWGGGCYQGQCFTFRDIGDSCNFEDRRCRNRLVCVPSAPTPAGLVVSTCQTDSKTGMILPLQQGVVGQSFSLKISDYLLPVTGSAGTPGVVYNMEGTRPGSNLQLTVGYDQSNVIVTAPSLLQVDAQLPQPQTFLLTVRDQYNQPRTATLLLFTNTPRTCSSASTCADCTGSACTWLPRLNRCAQQCLAGMTDCMTQPAQCGTCPGNLTCGTGTFCALNSGRCYPLAVAGSPCNDFVSCGNNLVCIPSTNNQGTCQLADLNCPSKDSCSNCATTDGCIWDGNLNQCSRTCPPGRLCITDYAKCPGGCRTDMDCLDGFCSGAQCSPFLELSQTCQGSQVCAPGLTCAFVSNAVPGVCKRDGGCGTSPSCQHCTRRGCAWSGNSCNPTCSGPNPQVGVCYTSSGSCPLCQDDSDCPSGYCLQGQCRVFSPIGASCTPELRCYDTLVCVMFNAKSGICQRNGLCTEKYSCGECTISGCYWTGDGCANQCPPNQICNKDVSRCQQSCASCKPFVEYCAGFQCVPYSLANQPCGAGLKCAVGLQCSPAGLCVLDGLCSTSTTCPQCTVRGCQWASGCSNRCPIGTGMCYTNSTLCPVLTGPKMTTPIPDPYIVDPNGFLFISFLQFFSSPAPLSYALRGLPIGTGLMFDSPSATLTGLPTLSDINSNPRLILTVSDPNNMFSTNSFQLSFLGCSKLMTCTACAQSGCMWFNNRCDVTCGPGAGSAACVSSPQACTIVSPGTCPFCCLSTVGLGHLCGALLTTEGSCCSSAAQCCKTGGGTGPGTFQCCADGAVCFAFGDRSECRSPGGLPPFLAGGAAYSPPATSGGSSYSTPAIGSAAYSPPATGTTGIGGAAYSPPATGTNGAAYSPPATGTGGAAYSPPATSGGSAFGLPATGSGAAYSPPATTGGSTTTGLAYSPPATSGNYGGYSPPATNGGYSPPATNGGYSPPATGGYSPPATNGGYSPPATGGYSPPATGGYSPPATGGPASGMPYTPPATLPPAGGVSTYGLAPSPNTAVPIGGPVAPQTGQQGDNVFLDISTYFFYAGPPPVSYSMTGAPSGTGLTLNSQNGQLSGAYSAADVSGSPFTIQFKATASGGSGAVSARFTVNASIASGVDCPAYVPCAGGYCIEGMCTQFQAIGTPCDAKTRCLPGVRCSLRPQQGVCEQAQCPLRQCGAPPAQCPPGASLQTQISPQGCAGCVSCIGATGNVLDPATFPCLAQPVQCDSPPPCPPNFKLDTQPAGLNYMAPCCPQYNCVPVPSCSLCSSSQYCKRDTCFPLSTAGQPCPDGPQQCAYGLQCRITSGAPACQPPIPAPTPQCTPGGSECPGDNYCKFGSCATFGVAGQTCSAMDPCLSPLLCMATSKTATSGQCQVDPKKRCSMASSCLGCVNLGCAWSGNTCDTNCASLKCSRQPVDCTGPQVKAPTAVSKTEKCASAKSCETCTGMQCAWSGDRCQQYCAIGAACYSTPALCPSSSRTGPQCPPSANTLCNGMQCQSDANCRQGLKCCAMGKCGSICVSPAITPKAQWCASSNDCPSSTFCNDGSCTPYVGVGASCRSSSQCPQPLTCQGLTNDPYTQGTCRVAQAQIVENVNAASSCCQALGPASCPDAYTADCVCSIDNYCCKRSWDDTCADLARYACGLKCDSKPLSQWPSTFAGAIAASCCNSHVGGGCNNAAIQGCVCAQDSYCCSASWDSNCVSLAQSCGGC